MSGLKHTLQTQLFDADRQQILSACKVTAAKKKKHSVLCLVTSAKPSAVVSLVQVKHIENQQYKHKRTWRLAELTGVDIVDAADSHELHLHLEKTYRWSTQQQHERQHFVGLLYRHIARLRTASKSGQPAVKFHNVPASWLTEQSPVKVTAALVRPGGDDDLFAGGDPVVADSDSSSTAAAAAGYEEFHALSEREEIDLTRLMSECTYAISNAELFMEQLTQSLQHLDGANVQSVLASEKQVDALMAQIESAIREAENVEQRLDEYDEILGHTRDSMEKMGEKNAMIDVANRNNIKLLHELDRLINRWDMSPEHRATLTDAKLTTDAGRLAATAAASALQHALHSEISAPLQMLEAAERQRRDLEMLRLKFSDAFNRHLNNLFTFLANSMQEQQGGSGGSGGTADGTLRAHATVHDELRKYGDLMQCMKCIDTANNETLTLNYTKAMSWVYEREIGQFLEHARRVVVGQSSREDLLMSTSMTASVSSKFKAAGVGVAGGGGRQAAGGRDQPYGVLGWTRDQWSVGVEASERRKYDALLERVLGELETVALAEQRFCVEFFHLDALSPTAEATIVATAAAAVDERDSSVTAALQAVRKTAAISGGHANAPSKWNVRSIMSALFVWLEAELSQFIESFEKQDSFYSMYVLVRLTQHVMSATDAQSFLSATFATALVKVKRNFDAFMKMQLQSICDAKLPRRSRCGLLTYVENFEEFAQTAESIFRTATRRNDLDKWLVELVRSIFERIPQHAAEHAKTPHQVVKMENFHRMHSLLAQLKVAVLEPQKREAKARYTEALRAYVTSYFGRPLEKLNVSGIVGRRSGYVRIR